MRTRECAVCEFMFDCKGKPTKEPCVNFKDRREDKSGGAVFKEVLDNEMRKN